MKFSTISILFIFVSSVCASPLPWLFRSSKTKAQPAPVIQSITELQAQLGPLAVVDNRGLGDILSIWTSGRDTQIGGKEGDGIFRLKKPYKKQRAVLHEISKPTSDEFIIGLARYLKKEKMLLAFAAFQGHAPNYVFIIADRKYRSLQEVGMNRIELREQLEKIEHDHPGQVKVDPEWYTKRHFVFGPLPRYDWEMVYL